MFLNKKQTLAILSVAMFLFLITQISSFPMASCEPENCPEGYYQSDRTCNNGACYITCSLYTGCSNNYTTVYTDSEYLPNLNIPSYSGADWIEYQLGNFTPPNSSKCYRFRQTTPNNFVSSSDIDQYSSLSDFDSGIALYWAESTYSKWYDHQNYYTFGAFGNYVDEDTGGVWVDSCTDDGDNFDSADSFGKTNSLYCAPNAAACDDFNASYCDSECYNNEVNLLLNLNVELDNGKVCNSFVDFANPGRSSGAEIDFVNFASQTIYVYVDEYDAILNNSFNNTCEYWTLCNPADPCCDQSGNFRTNGYVCKSAHNATCNTFSSGGCDGEAYEDRCTGTSSQCPNNNYLVDYDGVCTGIICASQSCSGSAFQPERTCNSNLCLTNQPYECPNNLNCLNSTFCKETATSQTDCTNGFVYDSDQNICWKNEGSAYNLFYDGNGNLLGDDNFNYTYNSLNYLVNVTNKSSGLLIANYFYDDNGIRVKKIVYGGGGNTTTYYFENFIQFINSSGVYNETYYYYYNDLVGKKDALGNILFYHQDHLGGTSLVTNSSGGVVKEISYTPFGEIIGNYTDRYTFTGHEFDSETGLIYMKARYYNPTTGQFLQMDNLIGNPYNSQDLNKYSYARNNPYKYIDPNGEWISPLDILDYVSLAHSIYSFVKSPSWENLGWLGVDIASAAVPIAGGFGVAGKSARYGEKAIKGVGIVENAAKAGKTTGKFANFFKGLDKVDGSVKASENLGDFFRYSDALSLSEKASVKGFVSQEKLQEHYFKHASEFGIKSVGDYEKAAKSFATSQGSDILIGARVRTGGDVIKYNQKTNEILVIDKSGGITSFYKPNPKVHGYKTNLEYYKSTLN